VSTGGEIKSKIILCNIAQYCEMSLYEVMFWRGQRGANFCVTYLLDVIDGWSKIGSHCCVRLGLGGGKRGQILV